MAAAVFRWWQMIHNGGAPTVIIPPAGSELLETTTGLTLLETTTGLALEET